MAGKRLHQGSHPYPVASRQDTKEKGVSPRQFEARFLKRVGNRTISLCAALRCDTVAAAQELRTPNRSSPAWVTPPYATPPPSSSINSNMPRRRRGHGWSRNRCPYQPQPPAPIAHSVRSSPRLERYYNRRIIAVRCFQGKCYLWYLTVALSPLAGVEIE